MLERGWQMRKCLIPTHAIIHIRDAPIMLGKHHVEPD